MPSYDLAPQVKLATILDQVRAAVARIEQETGRKPVVFGHSAGGHMAAALLSEGRAASAVAISGVFELAPLIPTSLNRALGMDAAEAEVLSPSHWPAPKGAVLDCVVGAGESSEFIRQSRDMAESWGQQGTKRGLRLWTAWTISRC